MRAPWGQGWVSEGYFLANMRHWGEVVFSKISLMIFDSVGSFKEVHDCNYIFIEKFDWFCRVYPNILNLRTYFFSYSSCLVACRECLFIGHPIFNTEKERGLNILTFPPKLNVFIQEYVKFVIASERLSILAISCVLIARSVAMQ